MMLVAASGAAPVPWKNGGGVTRELLRLPASGPGDWTLRISVADIAADGPFSPFDGVTRWFAVLAGAGVRLAWPGRMLDLRRGDAPLRFDGADAPGCSLLAGATRDLNVMVRRDRADALVTAATPLDEAEPGASTGFGFFALQPSTLHGAGSAPVAMPALSLAWREAPFDPAGAWRIEPSRDTGGGQEHAVPGYWIRLLPPTR
jgi:environmental stress-induced protein Ves